MLKTSCANSSSIVLFSRSEWHSHKLKWVHRKKREGEGNFQIIDTPVMWNTFPGILRHSEKSYQDCVSDQAACCPAARRESWSHQSSAEPERTRYQPISILLMKYLLNPSPLVCVCVGGGGGGGGTPFNVGWGCAAECVGTWPSSIIKGHKPCSRQKCENRCPVPTCSGTQAGTATLFFAARCWREKSNPDPGRVPKSEWAKSTTCSWQKRWFLDSIPDSERQKPYPVERHIPV